MVIAGLPVLAYLVVAVLRMNYPYELSYFEGSTVEVTARVVAGQPLYGPPTLDFAPWPYPPLYFWLTGAVASVTGLSLFPLRLVSFVASLFVLLLIGVIVRRVSGNVVAASVAVGLYAASYRVSGAWADTARVDSLLIAFLLAAVALGVRVTTWRGGIAVGGLLFLAFFTKQTALAVAAPMLLWLLLRRRPVGLGATVTLVLSIAGSTVLGDLLTGGWYSPYVVKQLLGQPWDLQWLYRFWYNDLLLPFAVVIVVSGWLLRRHRGEWAWSMRRLSTSRTDHAFLAACGIGAVAAAFAGRLHEGGFANVSMPAHAGLSIAVGLGVAWATARPRPAPQLLPGVAVALALQAVVMTIYQPHVLPSSADRAAGDRFVAATQELPGRVLIPSHPFYLRLAGLPVSASVIAVRDILLSEGGPNRDAMVALLPWSLDGVSAVVLDNTDDAGLFGPALTRDFTLVTRALVPAEVFLPVTDLPTHPAVLYVRTTEIG